MEKNSRSPIIVISIFLLILPVICIADRFLPTASYSICFTPNETCSDKIIKTIGQAKREILVQAYGFSDLVIARALIMAKLRGIDIKIILDKSQLRAKYSLISYFIKNNIYPVIDVEPAIAHNKIMIIDRHIVIGGSYNYTRAAKSSNAENVTIINDQGLADKYVRYWYTRKDRSKKIKILNAQR